MKYVMTYRAVDDFLPPARANGAAHVARLHEFHARGDLLMVGTFDDPMNGDAMGIFTSRRRRRNSSPATRSSSTASWRAGRCGRGTRCCRRGPEEPENPRTTGHKGASTCSAVVIYG
jgi:uncharacterized protein